MDSRQAQNPRYQRNLGYIRGLYVLIDPEHTGDRPTDNIAEAVLAGGARAIQLRDKKRTKGRILDDAWRLSEICLHARAGLIINDHPDIARIMSAAGVHLGQQDLPTDSARLVLDEHQLVGTSNASLEQVESSLNDKRADYIAVGAVFPTDTKKSATRFGLAGLKHVRKIVPPTTPLVAIGGIDADNFQKVVDTGVDAICIGSAITKSDDPEAAARIMASAF